MIRQSLVVLCAALSLAQAEIHLRKRVDEDAILVAALQEDEDMLHEYNNVTDVGMIERRDDRSYDKIEMCFGDCDTSEDCEEGLSCYHRDLDDPFVPGCSNDDNPDLILTNSVCVPQLPDGTWEHTSPILSKRDLLARCRGDCDRDSDCDGGLVCHQRSRGQPVPGCSGKNLNTNRDYCVLESQRTGFQSNLLGECQGDCNSDSDCEGDLVCLQRDAYDPIPNGCRGRLSWRTDYCVRPGNSGNNNNKRNAVTTAPAPAPASSPSTSTSGSFRLKIYWQPGYDWQGEYVERKWCLTHSYNVGGTCWNGLTRVTCQSDRTYVTKCGGSNQSWQFVSVGGGEVLIKISGQDRCLTRYGVNIELSSCNTNSNAQRFYAPNGDLNGRRFELSQQSARRYCLNQEHHPKNAEYVQMFPCTWTRARDSLTSYWERA